MADVMTRRLMCRGAPNLGWELRLGGEVVVNSRDCSGIGNVDEKGVVVVVTREGGGGGDKGLEAPGMPPDARDHVRR
jgi:hypothetical protein